MMSSLKVNSKRGVGRPKETQSVLKGKGNVVPKVMNVTLTSETENILSFPLLKTIDRDKMLPRYSSILRRTVEEGVGMDDLDALQLELEALLSAVVVRSRVLRKEIKAVRNAEEKTKKKIFLNRSLQSSAKKGNVPDQLGKKFKDPKLRDIGKTPVAIKFTKVKSIPARTNSPPNVCLPELEPQNSVFQDTPRLLQPRYDLPNKFWASVDAYCADVSNEDIHYLDELRKECENYVEQKIPPLGHHYSLRWAHEELMNEQKEACTESKDSSKVNQLECQVLLKKGEKSNDRSSTGPLTPRLVSALMEENIKMHGNEKTVGGENVIPLPNMFRNYVTGSSTTFERKVKKELEDQDMIEEDNQAKDSEDDEIEAEIKRCQSELQVLNNHNHTQLTRLISLAEFQMTRQEMKRKLQTIDNEIMENYRNVITAKQRKKTLTKSEQDHCWKALKERTAIIKQLNSSK